MPLPLVDEPIVDLLWVEASHRCEPHLIFFLPAAQHQATAIVHQVLVVEGKYSASTVG
jgi:hypothetical protein